MAEEKTLAEVLAGIKAGQGEPARMESPELWSPDTSIALCLFLSPIFDAYLHTENWVALREPERARRSRIFLWICTIVMVGATIYSARADNFDLFGFTSLGMLLVWYITQARLQVRYIKERLGGKYRAKSWLRAVVVAFCAYLAIGFVIMLLNGLVFHIE